MNCITAPPGAQHQHIPVTQPPPSQADHNNLNNYYMYLQSQGQVLSHNSLASVINHPHHHYPSPTHASLWVFNERFWRVLFGHLASAFLKNKVKLSSLQFWGPLFQLFWFLWPCLCSSYIKQPDSFKTPRSIIILFG